MKFSGYQSNAQLHVNSPHVYAPANPLAYGAGGTGMAAMGKAIGQVGQMVEKKQEEADTQDLLDAKNKLMTSLTQQMYNSENGLFTNGYGENAKGLTDRVTQTVRDTYDEIAKDYNGRVQQALRKAARDNVDNFQRMAASRESAEAVKMKGVRYDNALKNGAQLCGLNYNNDEMINGQLADGSRTIQAMGMDMGIPGEQQTAKLREMTTSYVGNAVISALNEKNYDRATKLLNTYKQQMDIKQWNEMYYKVQQKENQQNIYAKADEIWKMSGGNLRLARQMAEAASTGKGDYTQVDNHLAERFKDLDGTTMPHGGNGCVEAYVRLTNDSQFGKANAAETNVDNIVAAAEEDGRLVPFSQGELKPGDGVIYGDNDHIVVYDGAGGYYGNSTAQNMVVHGSNIYAMDGLQPTKIVHTYDNNSGPVDHEQSEKIYNRVQALYADNKQQEQQAKQERWEAVQNNIANAGSYTGALDNIDNMELDATEQAKAQRLAKSLYGGGGSSNAGGDESSSQPGTVDEYGDTIYTAKQFNSALTTFTNYLRSLETEGNISSAQWTKAMEASDILYNSGRLSQNDRDDIDKYRADEDRQATLTEDLNQNGYQLAYEHLKETNVSPIAAAIIISDIELMYQQ